MRMKSLLALALLGALVPSLVPVLAAGEFPEDMNIRSLLHDRIDTAHKGVGIVVGIIDEKGTRIISQGALSKTDHRAVDGDTIFEIGSVSKVFTASLLAEMAGRGEVKLDDPASKFLPKSVKMPGRNGKEITLLDLATQSSGLPRMPDNFTQSDPRNPYADYSVQKMYDFLSSYTLTRDIGEKYEYSNLGVGLLGHILALRTGANYEALVMERICRPLGMTNTFITLSPSLQARLATGHGEGGRPVPNWDIITLAGAGGLRSTVNDMLKFVSANMSVTQSPLSPALDLAQKPLRGAGNPNVKIGLCWHITTRDGSEIVWHNGATGGYHSFIGFERKIRRGIVVLANSANSIDDIGFHLVNAKFPLANVPAGKQREVVALPPATLDRYAGRYELRQGIFFAARRESDHLQVQLTGQSYLDLFPENETNFFYEVVDAQITFNKDDKGHVSSLVLHQNGVDQTARKISDEAPKERASIKLEPRVLDAYAGKYELAPQAMFTIKHSGGHLMAQLAGQTFLEVFPESETNFFYKVVDAQLTFVKNDKGEVTSLILHQNGLDQRADRIKE
jgi:D-alanyl-D-alanine-carboxypeptidase/D-alanyl-D-alanine-endopeptidase